MVLKHQHALIGEYNNDIAIQGVTCYLSEVIQDLLGRRHILFGVIKDRESLMIDKYEAFV